MTQVAIVYHSNGHHTAQLAQAVHCGAARVQGVSAGLLRVTPAQIDTRGRWRDLEISKALQQTSSATGNAKACT